MPAPSLNNTFGALPSASFPSSPQGYFSGRLGWEKQEQVFQASLLPPNVWGWHTGPTVWSNKSFLNQGTPLVFCQEGGTTWLEALQKV